MKYYLVGGCVRDKLLGRPVKDRDWVVVGATVEEMRQQGYQQVGKDFPVFLHPDTKEEYALARTERKTAPGYTGFEFHSAPDVTLEADLQRRDLSINAIAETATGEIIDPYQGRRDLELRLLRHVSPAFAEDPVRILRVARFAARYADLGFKVANETNELMCNMVEAARSMPWWRSGSGRKRLRHWVKPGPRFSSVYYAIVGHWPDSFPRSTTCLGYRNRQNITRRSIPVYIP